MKQIRKFPIGLKVKSQIEMPIGSKILCVQTQKGDPCIWAEVTNLNKGHLNKETRTFLTFGTGHDMPEDKHLHYIGTYQLYKGDEIYHVFEVK